MNTVVAELPLTISATIGDVHYSFLVDTGSSLSILPLNSDYYSFIYPTCVSLVNASGKPIKCHGELNTQIHIKSVRRSFDFTFVVADVMQPILGLDFLVSKGFIVDPKNRKLIDTTTNSIIPLNESSVPYSSYSVALDNLDTRVKDIFMKYPILTSPLSLSEENTSSNIKNFYHCIDTGKSAPVCAKARPLTGTKLQIAKSEFQFLLNAGRIRRSNSPWSSPLHLVPKSEPNDFRPCGDYRSLNSITTPDKYPVPHLRSIATTLHNKKIFSKLDLQRAYLQIPVSPDDIPKTAICTPFGLFEYLYMPFGLKNAGATFQRYMDTIFANVPNVFIYIDDILVASEDESEHHNDLQCVFKILAEHNLRITPKKCLFFQSSMTFLGYDVSADGIRPPSDRVKVISDFPLPTTCSELRRFIGMLNFFRPMIPNFANIAFHVSELLRLHPKSKSLPWNDDAIASFNNLKQALCQCSILKYPSPNTSNYHLVTDSSNYAVGAALYELIDNKPFPISFFSKKLSKVQQTYSTYDRELLAAYLAIINFKNLIDGHNVTLFVDHKPLVSAYHSKSIPKSDRQQRQLSYISEYVSDVQYVCGHDNVVADCLSRPVCATSVDMFDLDTLANAQINDTELDSFKDRFVRLTCSSNISLWCDTSTSVPRPFVPISCRLEIIKFLHNLAHPGVKTTSKLVKERYFWPCIDSDVKSFVASCVPCQQSKVHRHTRSPVEPISAPSDRFQTVHIDIVGPLPPATLPTCPFPLPYRYLLTCIDRATRWTEAIPLTDITAQSVAIAFTNGWVSRFGVPLQVVTDRGTQFESELFAELSSILGFTRIRTTSYNPKANGMIERFHRSLKASIMARKANWFTSLPIVLLGLRMSPKAHEFSPFTAVTGSYIMCPHPILSPESVIPTTYESITSFVKEMQTINFFDHSTGDCHSLPSSYVPRELHNATHVWLRLDRVRKSLEAPYTGPFEVVTRKPKYYVIKLPQGDTTVCIDRLKPAVIPSPKLSKPLPKVFKPSPPLPSTDPLPAPPSAPSNIERTRSGRTVKFRHNPEYHYF